MSANRPQRSQQPKKIPDDLFKLASAKTKTAKINPRHKVSLATPADDPRWRTANIHLAGEFQSDADFYRQLSEGFAALAAQKQQAADDCLARASSVELVQKYIDDTKKKVQAKRPPPATETQPSETPK